jgi:hypothetical protein
LLFFASEGIEAISSSLAASYLDEGALLTVDAARQRIRLFPI